MHFRSVFEFGRSNVQCDNSDCLALFGAYESLHIWMTSTKHCPELFDDELCRLIGPPYLTAWASSHSGVRVNNAELVDGGTVKLAMEKLLTAGCSTPVRPRVFP